MAEERCERQNCRCNVEQSPLSSRTGHGSTRASTHLDLNNETFSVRRMWMCIQRWTFSRLLVTCVAVGRIAATVWLVWSKGKGREKSESRKRECVCVCVWERKRERETVYTNPSSKFFLPLIHLHIPSLSFIASRLIHRSLFYIRKC